MGAINQLLFSSAFVFAGFSVVKQQRTPVRVVAAMVLFAWGALLLFSLFLGGD